MIVIDASVWVSYLIQWDPNHTVSRFWLTQTLTASEGMAAPMLLLAEVAGAIARQTGRKEWADAAVARLLAVPGLSLVAVDERLGRLAARLAAEQRLRGADACYVALAAALSIPLVSWDREQLDRAAAVVRGLTPSDE